jgi:hypothetical protein
MRNALIVTAQEFMRMHIIAFLARMIFTRRNNMLFGKTENKKKQDEQARLKDLYGTYKRAFARFPWRINDGRIAWLRIVYVKYPVVKGHDGEYSWLPFGKKTYYIEDK